jgi:hypothetical protein
VADTVECASPRAAEWLFGQCQPDRVERGPLNPRDQFPTRGENLHTAGGALVAFLTPRAGRLSRWVDPNFARLVVIRGLPIRSGEQLRPRLE